MRRKHPGNEGIVMNPTNPTGSAAPTIRAPGESAGVLALESVPTSVVDALLASGFERIENPPNGADWMVRFRHPQLDLAASRVMGRHFRPVVQLLGSYRSESGRCFGMVEYHLPEEVESLAVAQAFLAHAIDGAGNPCFLPTPPIPWLHDGRQHRALLPWERELARLTEAEATLPKCTVSRDWLRLGLKTLCERLANNPEASHVEFGFDGRNLFVAGAGHPLFLPADGLEPWPQVIHVPVRDLHLLPRRLMKDPVPIVVFSHCLQIDRALVPYAEHDVRKEPES